MSSPHVRVTGHVPDTPYFAAQLHAVTQKFMLTLSFCTCLVFNLYHFAFK